MLDADDVAALLPVPAARTDKYRRGVVGVVAGSDAYTGAAVLAVGGALRGGAGMVRFAVDGPPGGDGAPAVARGGGHRGARRATARPSSPPAGCRPGSSAPASGTDGAAEAVVRSVLGTDLPVLVDADALTVVARHPAWLRDRAAPTLLTPHAGEFARLLGCRARRGGGATR